MAELTTTDDGIREAVRERYAGTALSLRDADPDAGCCGSTASPLGCGNPTAVADRHDGETVLDLGSGDGTEVLRSARRVAPRGKAYGVDMTDEMLALAREKQRQAAVENAEFLKGTIESVPLPDDSVDVVISNCVINLSVDKSAVLTEIVRVLKPGGRIGISYVGCIAGALSRGEYEAGLEAAGFEDVSVEFTHEVADGMHGAIVKATTPVSRSR